MTTPDVKAAEARPTLTTHLLLEIAGVLLGAMIATCTGRLMSVGLADIRGALHLGVDEASWVTRLFGGEMGAAFMGHFIAIPEQFHSNLLGLNVQLRNGITNYRLLGFQHAFASHSTGLTAIGRAAEVLGLQVRQQAFTLAISDSFLLLAACCVACLVLVASMSTVPTQYRQVAAAPVEAK